MMAESRRVQLTTLPCNVPPSSVRPASAQKSPSDVEQGKENGSDRPADTNTVRLVLTLFEPDERSFPEFSYSQLVENKDTQVPLSRFEEEEKREHDEVAAISRKLEEKYGDKPKKKKDRIQDLIDIGYGYDEEDSFIDNSEAYDEFVPASITTKLGGFYINSGVLQFRQASETEDLTTEEPSKKRKVNGRQDKTKKKRCREGEEMMSSVDPKSSTVSEIGPEDEVMKKTKKKKAVGTLSVTSMLKKFQREKEKERQKMEKANQKPAAIMGGVTIPLCPADAAGGGGTGLTDPLLSLIGSTNDHALIQAANTVDFDIDLDSLLDVSEGTSSPKMVPQPAAELFRPKTDDPAQISPSLTQSDAAPPVQPPNAKTNLQLRPQSEPIQLLSQTSSTSPHQCVPLPEGLPPQLEDSIRKLMVVAKTSEGESKLKFFTPEINSILLEEEEKDGKEKVNAGPEDNVEEKAGKRGGPKKLFQWNDEIRESLCQVLQVKMERYKKERKGSQEVEEHLKTLLENEVKPLWPKGWMQSRVLIRESRKMLSPFTSLPVKRARPEKKQPSIVDPPASSDGCTVPLGSLPLKGLPQEADDVFIVSSNISNSVSLGTEKKEAAVLKKVDGKTGEGAAADAGSFTPAGADKPLATRSTPTHSLLDLLADQALAREQPLSVSEELLAAAVAKYKRSVQRWSFGMDTKSPPLPPPPPQSSPVGFPLSGVCHVLPQLLQAQDFPRHVDDHVQIISDDDDDVIIQ
ncbi:ubinuclein-1-like isoform X2 [Epinephelus moara]|uniref:ubinuclein-1-like isoform X2 n=1 Tax=Epinephelus moara TaxID=300413 RepID=UPI00214ED429|nr:ubinuclein-1-like isoform X2 [Epinephelus moara]